MSTDTRAEVLTIGEVAEQLGIQLWRLRRAYDRRIPGMPEGQRVGKVRCFVRGDLEAIRDALTRGGYLNRKEAILAS
jgi:hypothetical protein